jgi:glycosyltransferase involved in cell wall biosynthesis
MELTLHGNFKDNCLAEVNISLVLFFYLEQQTIGMTGPLVTVIVPCFNASRTLARTLESIHKQTYVNIEIIMVDDGSTDASASIAEEFTKRDSRARLFRQNNRGVATARNRAIDDAAGEFIAPIDADDLWNEQKVEKSLKGIMTNPRCGLVYNWFENINDNDEIFFGGFRFSYNGYVLPHLSRFDFIGNGSSVLMRTLAVRSVGGYDASLRARGAEGCEDWHIALRIAESCEFGVVGEALTGYRHSAGNMSNRVRQMIRSAELVATEFSLRHPELADGLSEHLLERKCWYFLRCIKERRPADAWFFGRQLLSSGAPANTARLIGSIRGSVRALSRRWPRRFTWGAGLVGSKGRRKFV